MRSLRDNVFHETENGTPQGSPISPVLANLALDGLEAAAIGHFSRRLRRQRQIHLVRFADDFVVFGRSKELLETDIKPRIESFLAERGLTLSPEKTKVTTIEERIRFLSNDTSKSNGFLVAGVSWSQTATIQKEETNMTGQADLAGIERYVTTEMARLRIPGLALGIVHGDRIVEARGFGVADSSGRAVTAQTPFYIGSLTKSFVALAVMQLVEAGRIDLDAPVRNYLPWFQVADRQASGRITVRQLLNQTTGLSQKDGNHVWSSSAGIEEEVRAFGNVPLAHPVAAASNTATSTSASPG